MQKYLILVRRELGSYFASLSGYVIITGVAFLLGLSFTNLIQAFNHGATITAPLTEVFYNTQYFWLILLLASPVITMRTFAHEKATGTYETLMTAPVGDLTVVLAKFTGALVFFMISWIPLVACLAIVGHYTTDPFALEPGILASTFLGIVLIGGTYMALGIYASAVTSSQAVAAMIALALGIALFLLSFPALSDPTPAHLGGKIFSHISMIEHLQDFSRGMVDTRRVVYYLSVIVMFLFMTLKSVESRRWK